MNHKMSPSPALLHLGCGLIAPPEWVNVDGSWNAWLAQHRALRGLLSALRLVKKSQNDVPWPTNVKIADLRRHLPFADNTFDAAYASHLLEHLYREAAVGFLRELIRVVKPGGLIRMLVPDLGAMVREYAGQAKLEDGEHEDDPARRLCGRLLMRAVSPPRGGLLHAIYHVKTDFHSHKSMYDGSSLMKLMTEAGLRDCREMGFRDSEIPFIDKVEMPGRFLNGAGVAAEGRKD